MKTKLAALCGTLMMVGCGADLTATPDLARPEAGELETVFIDCTDLGDADVVQRPQFDGPGSFQITESGIARPDKDGPDAAARLPGPPVLPTNGEPGEGIVRPEFDGADSFAMTDTPSQSWSDYRPVLDGQNPVNTVSSDDREFPRDPDQVSGEDVKLPANPCNCPDTLCREQWIDANLGCDVCAVFGDSDDQQVGACNHCQ